MFNNMKLHSLHTFVKYSGEYPMHLRTVVLILPVMQGYVIGPNRLRLQLNHVYPCLGVHKMIEYTDDEKT